MWTRYEKERWRIRTNIETTDMLQTADIVIFLKSLCLGYFGYVERMHSQRMPEEIATATLEGRRKGENNVKERGASLKRM
jgi:hypothetical protein